MDTSIRPYLIRAVYEWGVDNGLTPMLMVRERGTLQGAAKESDLLMLYNISPQAVRDLVVDEESIRFHTRVQGIAQDMVLDLVSVVRVYCRENKEGLWLSLDSDPYLPPEEEESLPKGRPHLTVVK